MCYAGLFVGLSSLSVVNCCFCSCFLWTVIPDNVIEIFLFLMLYFFEGQVVHSHLVGLADVTLLASSGTSLCLYGSEE